MNRWIESFVGQLRSLVRYSRWSATFVGQIEVSEDTLDGEDTIHRSRA
ncbi:hypothetical protein T4C_13067 [Trichinella pseudospiralis]|uniref:Uncharacterized protein n=1 Tax=Trichinella pseudospiralis TaxID=6337 RepID=A0A0V1IQI9_TRIPS|nr:hypothetical protein T4C_13067 [Trichinella pseudospiralis]